MDASRPFRQKQLTAHCGHSQETPRMAGRSFQAQRKIERRQLTLKNRPCSSPPTFPVPR